MFNPKVLIITAAVGFVLSFLAGLFSGISFGYILLRALISAIILVLVAIGISYISKTFLDVSVTLPVSGETTTGTTVDITVADEALPEESGAPEFYVADPEGIEKNDAQNSEQGFKPAGLASVVQFSGGNTASVIDRSAGNVPVQQTVVQDSVQQSSDAVFDELPDMNSFISGSDDTIDSTAETVTIPDSVKESKRIQKEQSADMKDSQVLAQALRTMISRDS